MNVVEYNTGLQRLSTAFHSGNIYLDSFLKGPNALDPNTGKTYVFLSEENDAIIGYYNIGTGDVEYVEDGLRRKAGGSVHINCFALDENYHGFQQSISNTGEVINLSDVLLRDCLERIYKIRETCVGFTFITLASTEAGYSLYVAAHLN